MIYLNRDKKTKKLKPTDGLKSRAPTQKWRIYELNDKIKPFRLRINEQNHSIYRLDTF